MIDRIKAISAHYGLSSTAFADRIEVARPVISHIFSERNRPSLEVVQKIGTAFPEVNTDWLLYGQGQMLRIIAALPLEPGTRTKAEKEEREKPKVEEAPQLNKINAIPEEQKVVPVLPASGGKSIRKVLIFYSDHTFEEFNPTAQN